MTDGEWEIVVEAFRAARSRRGGRGQDDRQFLEALHYFAVHNLTWRALPREFGKWTSIWKRFGGRASGACSRRCWRSWPRPAALRTLFGWSDRRSCAPTSRRLAQKGAEGPGAWPLARRIFNQDPPEVRFQRSAPGRPPDRRPSQRQP